MREMLNKYVFIVYFFVSFEITAQVTPPPPVPPPPGLPIDDGVVVLCGIALLFGFYKMYISKIKKKRSI